MELIQSRLIGKFGSRLNKFHLFSLGEALEHSSLPFFLKLSKERQPRGSVSVSKHIFFRFEVAREEPEFGYLFPLRSRPRKT